MCYWHVWQKLTFHALNVPNKHRVYPWSCSWTALWPQTLEGLSHIYHLLGGSSAVNIWPTVLLDDPETDSFCCMITDDLEVWSIRILDLMSMYAFESINHIAFIPAMPKSRKPQDHQFLGIQLVSRGCEQHDCPLLHALLFSAEGFVCGCHTEWPFSRIERTRVLHHWTKVAKNPFYLLLWRGILRSLSALHVWSFCMNVSWFTMLLH